MQNLLFKQLPRSLSAFLSRHLPQASAQDVRQMDLGELLTYLVDHHHKLESSCGIGRYDKDFIKYIKYIRNRQAHRKSNQRQDEYQDIYDLSDVIQIHRFLLMIGAEALAKQARSIILEMIPKARKNIQSKTTSEASFLGMDSKSIRQVGIAIPKLKGTRLSDEGLVSITIWIDSNGNFVSDSLALKNDIHLLAFRVTSESDTIHFKNFNCTDYIAFKSKSSKSKSRTFSMKQNRSIKLTPVPPGAHNLLATLQFPLGNPQQLSSKYQIIGRGGDFNNQPDIDISCHPHSTNLKWSGGDRYRYALDNLHLSRHHFSLINSNGTVKGKMRKEASFPVHIIQEDRITTIQPGTKGEQNIPNNAILVVGWYLIAFY